MLNINLHRQTMLQILRAVYSQPAVASSLGFKDGTAVYLLYNLPRFSVDLDFDLLNKDKEEKVFAKFIKILEKFGKLEQATVKHYTLFYLLSYGAGWQKLKVEISRRPEISAYELKQFLGIPLLVMVREDMFANKLVALTERKIVANRDLFDLHFFLSHRWSVNTSLVEKRTGKKYLDYLQKCLDLIKTVPKETLLANMGELVDNKTKAWIKTHLKEELLSLLAIHQNSFK